MTKSQIYKKELGKLNKLFNAVEPAKSELVEGLIMDAAFLKAENEELRNIISETGMIKKHPINPDIQKTTEAGKQYLKNINTYAIIIKTLNSVLSKNLLEEDGELNDYE